MEMVVMFECAQNFFENFVSYYLKMEENSEGESYFFKYRHTYDVVDYMKQLVRDKKEKDLPHYKLKHYVNKKPFSLQFL